MAKQVKEEKVKRIGRAEAANRVLAQLNGSASLSELAEKADAIFVEHGGESKPKAAAGSVKRSLETMESLGLVKLVRPTDIQVTRVKK